MIVETTVYNFYRRGNGANAIQVEVTKNERGVHWTVYFSEKVFQDGDVGLNDLIEVLQAARDKVEELGG